MIRRRRECNACNRRFTTYERFEKTQRLMVVKKDGSRDPFDAEKVLRGLHAACGKRPVPEAEKAELVTALEEELHAEFEREVPSEEIGRRVAARLKAVDDIAYIRYASEYHEFRSLDDFAQELRELRERVPDLPNQGTLFSG